LLMERIGTTQRKARKYWSDRFAVRGLAIVSGTGVSPLLDVSVRRTS